MLVLDAFYSLSDCGTDALSYFSRLELWSWRDFSACMFTRNTIYLLASSHSRWAAPYMRVLGGCTNVLKVSSAGRIVGRIIWRTFDKTVRRKPLAVLDDEDSGRISPHCCEKASGT